MFKFGIHVHRWRKNRKKNLQFFFRTPKLQNNKIRTKKKFVEINFRKENFSKKIEKIILAIFLYLKKNSVEIRLIQQSKDRKFSVKISVNLG